MGLGEDEQTGLHEDKSMKQYGTQLQIITDWCSIEQIHHNIIEHGILIVSQFALEFDLLMKMTDSLENFSLQWEQ